MRNLAIAAILALLALFTALNWKAFNAPTTLSVGVTEVQAPLGLVMLGVTAFVSVIFLAYVAVQQAGLIVESRRLAKELKTQRELADQAEASRFVELRAFVQSEGQRFDARHAASMRELGARLDSLEKALPVRLEEALRTLSAHLGEVEDKLDRVIAPAPGR